MIDKWKILNTYFFDIEVVTEFATVEEFRKSAPAYYKHWEKIVAKYKESEEWSNIDDQKAYYKWGSLYPEFSKIISVAMGKVTLNDQTKQLEIKIGSIANQDEKVILKIFSDALGRAYAANRDMILCGHNIIEYDNPHSIKRFIKNEIRVPDLFRNCIDRKPWEMPVLDTIHYWKFGGKRFAALGLISEFLGMESPKDDMDGSMVNPVYWNAEDKNEALKKIAIYNEKDVKATIDMVMKLSTF